MSFANFDQTQIERERAEFERLAVGPVGSALLVFPRPHLFLKVHWNDDLRAVAEYAQDHVDFDVYTQWKVFSQDNISTGLDIGWPDLGKRVLLYFELDKWRYELQILLQTRGMLFLAAEDATAMEMLNTGLGVQCETDVLPPVLAAYDLRKADGI